MYNLILCGIKIPKSIKMRYHELQVYVLSRLRHAAYITSLLRPRANVDALSLWLSAPRGSCISRIVGYAYIWHS